MSRVMTGLERLRQRLLPREMDELGWQPVFWLAYLGFLFMPLLFRGMGEQWLWPTLLTIPVFLLLYFRALAHSSRNVLPYVLAMCALGYALSPINPNGNTYLIYAAVFAPFTRRGLRWTLAFVLAMLAVYAVQIWLLGLQPLMLFVASFVSIAAAVGNHFYIENQRKQAALRLSHDEVRRLAATAERERIGRDLHDLLGHTLSLVALKSELASRLCERDAAAARREIDEVQRIARDALSQVRHAVTGIRAAGIAAELASARLLLESEGVGLAYDGLDVALPADTETVLALVIREAVTNVHRHARAAKVRIELHVDGNAVHLQIADDGRGAQLVPGTGLNGMRERVEAAGGNLRIDSARGSGTRIEACLPLPASSAEIVAMPPRMQA